MIASSNGHTQLSDYLISIGCKIDVVDNNGRTTLFRAATNGNLEGVKYLISKGLDPNASSNDSSPFMTSVYHGKSEIVKYFVEELKCDPNQISKDGKNALSIAIEQTQFKISEYLISKMDIKITIVHALQHKNLEVLKFMHSKGVDLNIPIEQELNPLMISSSNGKLEIVKFLIEQLKLDPNQISKDGTSALSIAIEKDHKEIIDYLFSIINHNITIFNAIQNDQFHILKLIHLKGIDLNISDEQGLNPLMIASSTGKLEIVKYLVEELKFDPNQISKDGKNALSTAIEKNQIEISDYLILKVDHKRGTFNAIQNDQIEVLKFLHSKGIDLSISNEQGLNPLMIASSTGKLEIVKYLVSLKCDPNQTNNEFQTCLHISAFNNQLEIVKYLFSIGCNPIALDKNKRMPIDLAKDKGHQAIVDYLSKIPQQYYNEMRSATMERELELTNQIQQLQRELNRLKNENKAAFDNFTKRWNEEEIERTTSHLEQLNSLRRKHSIELQSQIQSRNKEIREMNSNFEKNQSDLKSRFSKEILELKEFHDQQKSNLQEAHLQELQDELEKSNQNLLEQSTYFEQLLTDARKDRQNSLSNLQIQLESKYSLELKSKDIEIENLRKQLRKEEIRKSFQYQRQIEDLEQQLKIEANSSKTINIREVDCEKDLPVGIVLGDGGFGKVFKSKLGIQNVAVKTIKLENIEANDLPKIKESFEKELEILNRARHPNIVNVVGACKHIDHLSIVLELAERGSLYRYLHQTTGFKFSEEQAIKILIDIGNGMNYLHQFKPQIIHRDLKSDNILLFSDWTAKVTDFGLSKLKETSSCFKSSKTKPVGTVNWMAPEMFDDDLAKTDKVDVYSFGMVIYEMLSWSEADRTHLKPWSGKSEHGIISSVLKQQRPPLPIAKDPIIELMKQCWAQHAHERPTFSVIVSDLEKMDHSVNPFVHWKMSPDLILSEGWTSHSLTSKSSSSQTYRELLFLPLPSPTTPTTSTNNRNNNNAINLIHHAMVLENEKLNSILGLLHTTTTSTIEQAHVIDNSTIQGSFESRMDALNSKKLENNLRTTWKNKAGGQFRETVMRKFEEFAQKWPYNQTNRSLQLIPMFHGLQDEKSGWSIAGTGFSSLQTDGWFGSGIYFTTNLEYACKYVKQPTEMAGGKKGYWIMLSWVLVGNVYPVIEPETYHGKPLEAGYDAHWTMVKPQQTSNRLDIPGSFIPLTPKDHKMMDENLTELVVNQESQCLPMYLLYVTK